MIFSVQKPASNDLDERPICESGLDSDDKNDSAHVLNPHFNE